MCLRRPGAISECSTGDKVKVERQMKKEHGLRGSVFSGLGQGRYFTQLDWVKDQCRDKVGFIPYPGTLNVRIEDRYLPVVASLRKKEGIRLIPPNAQSCEGKGYRASLNGTPVAIVIPMVDDYPRDILEIIAPVNLRETLSLTDGSKVAVAPEENE